MKQKTVEDTLVVNESIISTKTDSRMEKEIVEVELVNDEDITGDEQKTEVHSTEKMTTSEEPGSREELIDKKETQRV